MNVEKGNVAEQMELELDWKTGSKLYWSHSEVKVLVAQWCPSFCDPMDCSLLCPWNSPGNNTGLGRHFLLQGIFPIPWIKPTSPALQAVSLLPESPGKPTLKSQISLKKTPFRQPLGIFWILKKHCLCQTFHSKQSSKEPMRETCQQRNCC